jgi:hypothetical protein
MMGVFAAVGMSGCKKNSDVQTPPLGILLSYDGCKEFQGNSDSPLAVVLVPPTNDCIDYNYDGSSTLILNHINAGFNCYPGEITADIVFNGNIITITEKERDSAADCICLYDLEYNLENLPPGLYTIRVIGLYVEMDDEPLECSVELFSATTGRFCVERNYYPWVN